MGYVNMTFLISAIMGIFCAIPILNTRHDNALIGAFGAFIGGFLFSLPFTGIALTIIYAFLHSFMLQFIFATWLTIFSFINYMDGDYVIHSKRLGGNGWKALMFAIPIYVFYKAICT